MGIRLTRKPFMISSGRKAKRESLASQRARLQFITSLPLVVGVDVLNGRRAQRTNVAVGRRDVVRDGLLGFIPSGAH